MLVKRNVTDLVTPTITEAPIESKIIEAPQIAEIDHPFDTGEKTNNQKEEKLNIKESSPDKIESQPDHNDQVDPQFDHVNSENPKVTQPNIENFNITPINLSFNQEIVPLQVINHVYISLFYTINIPIKDTYYFIFGSLCFLAGFLIGIISLLL
jgi:hypothetical protein